MQRFHELPLPRKVVIGGCWARDGLQSEPVFEAHNRASVQMTREENKRLLEQMTRLSLPTGHAVFGWALTAFGCPLSGDVPPSEAIAPGRFWRDVGAELIGFGDTVGVANPLQVSRFYEEVLAAGLPRDRSCLHRVLAGFASRELHPPCPRDPW